MPKYKAGQSYLVTVLVEIQVKPEEDCNGEGLGDYAVAAMLAENDLGSCVIECKIVGDNSSLDDEDSDEDCEPEDKFSEAKEIWDELRHNRANKTDYPDLNPKQLQFVQDCIDSGKEVRLYSGRGMYGRYCPGCDVSSPSEVRTSVKYAYDSMGLGLILYVP